MSPSALGSLTTCGRSPPSVPPKSVRGLRPMSTPRSSPITSPSDRRSTPSTGRGTGTGSCGSGAPHRRQTAPPGGFTCRLGQSRAGTTGPMRSGGVVRATRSGSSPRVTVDLGAPGPDAARGAGVWRGVRSMTTQPASSTPDAAGRRGEVSAGGPPRKIRSALSTTCSRQVSSPAPSIRSVTAGPAPGAALPSRGPGTTVAPTVPRQNSLCCRPGPATSRAKPGVPPIPSASRPASSASAAAPWPSCRQILVTAGESGEVSTRTQHWSPATAVSAPGT